MVGQTVRKIRKNAQFEVVGGPRRRPRVETASHGCSLWQSGGLVAGVGCDHGHMVAAPCEAAREGVDQAGYPSVRPGVGGVGRDVKDSEWPGFQ